MGSLADDHPTTSTGIEPALELKNASKPQPTVREGDLTSTLVALCIETFCSHAENRFDPAGRDDTTQCGKPVTELLHYLSRNIRSQQADFSNILKRLDNLLALANEKFYTYPFKDVPPCWRDLFRSASLLKFTALASKGYWAKLDVRNALFNDQELDELVKVMDMTLIMVGKPLQDETVGEVMESSLQLLQSIHLKLILQSNEDTPPFKRRKIENRSFSQEDRFPPNVAFTPPVKHPVRMPNLDFIDFEAYMQNPPNINVGPEPILLQHCLEHWPALDERPWKRPSYLLSKTIGGRRLVPIELGRSYVDEGWGQKIISFGEFLDEYILHTPPSPISGTGYLAQHDLLSQIPSLRADISIPDLCYATPPPPHYSSPLFQKHSALPKLEEPLLNVWFGPAGTISPLHTDPYHNILAQVVGRKYVRLYAPSETKNLYPRGTDEGINMENTSSLDVGLLEGWDGVDEEQREAIQAFPLFKNAQYVDCILEEGQCLYIPLGWWHYVRSLTISFSVSFWFN